MGKGSWTPTAVFETFDAAYQWIKENELTGHLSEYPIGISVYDWAVENGYYKPKDESQKSVGHIQKFGTSYLRHEHYFKGELGTEDTD
jgi:hypothetical protein